jgi:hypothetical protein
LVRLTPDNDVIEKLVKGGIEERKWKQLITTKDGTNLVCVLPDSYTSPQLNGGMGT